MSDIIVGFLMIFAIATVGFIYVFQMLYLDDFYLENRVNAMISVADKVANSIDSDKYDTVLHESSFNNEVCVYVFSSDPNISRSNNECSLKYLKYQQIKDIMQETYEDGGEKLFRDYHLAIIEDKKMPMYLYAKAINNDSTSSLIMVSTIVTPLDSTIATIRGQFWLISILVAIFTLILGFSVSKKISEPLKRLKEASASLPLGKYETDCGPLKVKEYEELDETLKEANQEIIKAEKARKELLSNVSHDLRTPLTMIVGYSEMMKDIEEERNIENLDIIIKEAKRLNNLVNDLLDVSRIENSALTLHKEEVSINNLLNNVYEQYRKYCESLDIDFKLLLDEDGMVSVDTKRIEQVLYNFINNALNYNNSKHKEIVLSSNLKDGKYRIAVKDNGIGIAEKDLPYIWDRYYRVDEEHTRSHVGSGIGLSLAKDLLVLHGFKYGVESKENEYSIFWFELEKIEKDNKVIE